MCHVKFKLHRFRVEKFHCLFRVQYTFKTYEHIVTITCPGRDAVGRAKYRRKRKRRVFGCFEKYPLDISRERLKTRKKINAEHYDSRYSQIRLKYDVRVMDGTKANSDSGRQKSFSTARKREFSKRVSKIRVHRSTVVYRPRKTVVEGQWRFYGFEQNRHITVTRPYVIIAGIFGVDRTRQILCKWVGVQRFFFFVTKPLSHNPLCGVFVRRKWNPDVHSSIIPNCRNTPSKIASHACVGWHLVC